MPPTALLATAESESHTTRADESTLLTDAEETLLVNIVEVAHAIVRRHQFFLWARGALQALVPHEILLCGYGDWRHRSFTVDRFAARPFPEEMYRDLCDADTGIVLHAHSVWESIARGPLLIHADLARSNDHLPLVEVLQRHRLVNCMFHGVPQVNGSPSVFFGFANIPPPITRRTRYFVELVMPSLYTAMLRVIHSERRGETAKVPRNPVRPRASIVPRTITLREVQILQWVQEGKSNREIAEELKLSPLTVKNHVQNILKKLKVRNRAQAVSRAIGARLIQSTTQSSTKEKVVRTAQPVKETR